MAILSLLAQLLSRTPNNAVSPDAVQGFRPPQWGNQTTPPSPPLTITLQGTKTNDNSVVATSPNLAAPVESENGPLISSVTGFGGVTVYTFDNALHASHEQELVITQNPIQTGASVSDHSYLLPARLTVEILMSDAMQSYTVGQFGTKTASNPGASRSVNAYQTLLELQASGNFLQIATRLNSYNNMLIASVRPEESASTRFGLKCAVTFQQVIVATVSTLTTPSDTASSAIPAVTGVTPSNGNVSPVSQAVIASNSVTNAVSSAANTAASSAP